MYVSINGSRTATEIKSDKKRACYGLKCTDRFKLKNEHLLTNRH